MKYLLLLALFLAAGCPVAVGAGNGMYTVPRDTARTCWDQCQSIGLELSGVALMANTAGCICQPGQASAREGAAATAGMATIMMQQQELERQQHQQQQLQQQR